MNYERLLQIPYKTFKVFITIILIVIVMVLFLGNLKVCDVYNTNAYFKNNKLILNIPVTYSDTILNGEYLKIADNKYDIKITYISDILIDSRSMINYQEVILDIPDNCPENLVVNTSIYYNKEKVFIKLKKLL